LAWIKCFRVERSPPPCPTSTTKLQSEQQEAQDKLEQGRAEATPKVQEPRDKAEQIAPDEAAQATPRVLGRCKLCPSKEHYLADAFAE